MKNRKTLMKKYLNFIYVHKLFIDNVMYLKRIDLMKEQLNYLYKLRNEYLNIRDLKTNRISISQIIYK